MKKKVSFLIAMALTLTIAPSVVFAHGHGHGHRGGYNGYYNCGIAGSHMHNGYTYYGQHYYR